MLLKDLSSCERKIVQQAKKQLKRKTDAMGLSTIKFTIQSTGRCKINPNQKFELDMSRFLAYLQTGGLRQTQTAKRLEVIDRMLRLGGEVPTYTAQMWTDKIYLGTGVCNALVLGGFESWKQRIFSQSIDFERVETLLKPLGYEKEMKQLQIKKIFNFKKAEEEVKVLIDEQFKNLNPYWHYVSKTIEEEIYALFEELNFEIGTLDLSHT